MPYARKRSVRRKAYRRRRGVRKGTHKVIKQVVNRALRSNVEVKRYMSSQVEATVSTTIPGANWLQLGAAIQRGTGSDNRVGDKIKIIGIKMDCYMINQTTYPLWVRECLIRPSDKTTLSDTSLLLMGTSNQTTDLKTTLGMNSIMRQFHPNTVAKVYRNKVYKLPGTGAVDGEYLKRFRFFKKFGKGITVTYNASGVGSLNVEPTIGWGIWAADAAEDANVGTIELSYQYTIYYTDA